MEITYSDVKSCRLEATDSLGTCDRKCGRCSWFQTQAEIQKALDYRERFRHVNSKKLGGK